MASHNYKMKTELNNSIQSKAQDLFQKVKGYREHLHMHPELSYQEYDTMAYVVNVLQSLGIKYTQGIGKTGVVALIKNERHDANDPCIGLRADLDALPIHEENNVAYRSKNDGVMHACGHDAHTAILLGVAEILNELKEHLSSPVKLIFQPGEEKNPGGATLMIADGVLTHPNVREMYALHVQTDLPVGKVGFKEGLYMASADEIYITIHGKGGHGAMPHLCIDPIVIGANIVTQLQQIISRKCDPKIPCVLTFGHFEALGATNIIPEKALLKGTFRTMNEKWRGEALEMIEQQINLLAQSQGATAEVTISRGYPYLENDPTITNALRNKAKHYFGEENVEDLPIRLTSEDFAFYAQEVPICFFRLGVGNKEKGIIYNAHHPKFDIDEEALLIGMQAMCLTVL